MTEGQSLFAILILLYLSDCLVWIGRQGVLFAPVAGGYRYCLPGKLAGNLKGALIRLRAFPPFRPCFETAPMPFSISDCGICAWIAAAIAPLGRPPQSGDVYRYEDIETIDGRGAELRINRRPFAAFRSHRAAMRAAALIRDLQRLPPEDRAGRLEAATAELFDEVPVRERIELLRRATRWIAPLSHGYFFLLLVVAPLVCRLWGVNRMLIPVAVILFGHVLILAGLYVRAHHELFPGEPVERRLRAFILCVSWPMAVRVPVDLGRHALSDVHPLAAARVLLPIETFRELAGRFYRDTLHPLPADDLADDQRRIVSADRERVARVLAGWLDDADSLTAPPALSPEETRYCPRCHTGYLDSAETCIECYGLPLHPISPPQQTAS